MADQVKKLASGKWVEILPESKKCSACVSSGRRCVISLEGAKSRCTNCNKGFCQFPEVTIANSLLSDAALGGEGFGEAWDTSGLRNRDRKALKKVKKEAHKAILLLESFIEDVVNVFATQGEDEWSGSEEQNKGDEEQEEFQGGA